jgi:TrkA domain protein
VSDVQETQLPGVGVRHDFVTQGGDRVGMISHRSGHRELLIYDSDDPDACRETLRLEEDDVRTLADMLGGSEVTEGLTNLQQQVEGLTIDWVPVKGASACEGRTLRDIGLRADMGASIVAVLREGETIASPSQEFTLRDGDTAVVVGTGDGVKQMLSLLQGG